MLYFLSFCALVGGFAAAFFVYLLAIRKGELLPMSLILAGVAVTTALQTVITVLPIQLASGNFEFARQWLLRPLWGVSWSFVFAILPWILLIVPLAWYRMTIWHSVEKGTKTDHCDGRDASPYMCSFWGRHRFPWINCSAYCEKNMKKISVLLLTCIIIGIVMDGCGGKEKAAKKEN